jgi:hypothetical protein
VSSVLNYPGFWNLIRSGNNWAGNRQKLHRIDDHIFALRILRADADESRPASGEAKGAEAAPEPGMGRLVLLIDAQ